MVFALPGFIYAFHEGGEGYCEGCHVSHEYRKSRIQGMWESESPFEVQWFDSSSICLRCHARRGKLFNVLSKDGSRYTPGGDFYWLKKTFTWFEDGKINQSSGDNHGHNIVAVEYGLYEDSKLGSSPGGAYPAAALGCTSCHDPHGMRGNDKYMEEYSGFDSHDKYPAVETTVGDYRLLGGVGYNGGMDRGDTTFRHPAPIAAGDPRDWVETDSNHTAYGSGMSEWCGNCHPDFLNGNNKHPAGNGAILSSTIISNYNSYVKTGDITGTQDAAYLALVPFELGTTDTWLLDPSSTSGPDAGQANVMCLTCHRAHASAFRDIGRWDFGATFIADSHPQPGDGGASGNSALHSYYGRDMDAEFGPYQRQLCNKCHLLD
jgi:cytochrome c553